MELIRQPMSEPERQHLIGHRNRELKAGLALVIIFLGIGGALLFLSQRETRSRARRVDLSFVGASLILSAITAGYCAFFKARVARDLEEGIVAAGQTTLVKKYIGQTKGGNVNCLILDPEIPKKKIQVTTPTYVTLAAGDRLEIRFFPHSKVLMSVRKIY